MCLLPSLVSGSFITCFFQIDINTYHLEDSNADLEHFISEATGASADATHVARLQGRSIFKDIRVEAEEEIHSKLLSKVRA